jgi:hypothetical protein
LRLSAGRADMLGLVIQRQGLMAECAIMLRN